MRAHMILSRAVVTALIAAPSAIAAQLPSASPAAHGMGGNFTAIARGYEAIAWNPANLAMPGRPLISVGVGVLGGSLGIEPVDFRTLSEWSGQVVPVATRQEWVEMARLSGGQHGRLDAGVTPFALSIGPVGLQFGGSANMNMSLSPDVFEAVLFGNAGNNNGQPKEIDFTGSKLNFAATSAGALSFAFPIPINLTNGALPAERAAIGFTGKYVMGNGLVYAQDMGSTIGTGAEVEFTFPTIQPDSNFKGTLGNGVGVDLSLAWSGGPWRVGLMAENVFNSFAWDTTGLTYSRNVGYFDADSSSTDFDTREPFSAAPQALKDAIVDQKFMPAFTLGAAFKLTRSLTLTADVKQSTGGDDAIVIGPKSRMGVGAEWRVLPFLPIRGGVASVTDGWQAGAGIGLRLLGYELGVSTSIRRRGSANESGFMLGLVGIGR